MKPYNQSQIEETRLRFALSEKAPEKLIWAFIRAECNFQELARRHRVNVSYIHKLLKNGIEPNSPEIRKKLYLPARPPREIPEWVREGTNTLAALEKRAGYRPIRTYNRHGKRVR